VHTMGREDVRWDLNKARANLAKHGVDFVDVAEALEDPNALTMRETTFPEARVVTLCSDADGCLLVVVYATSEDGIRLISARRATRRERRMYQEAP